MRLTTIILIASLMQVSAATFGQKLTLQQNNIALKQVFKEIRKQTGYDVLYQPEKVNENQKVKASFDNTPLNVVLDQVLKGQSLDYAIKDKTIVITQKESSFLDKIIYRFDNIDVHGRVTDEKGLGLPGATVRVIGGTRTKTDRNGDFHFQNVDEKAMVEVSFIGYQTQILKAGKSLLVTLILSDSKLDEVQVIAYGTTTQRLSAGNHVKITAADIAKQPVNNIMGALAGRVPGMSIMETNGNPGAAFNVQIRGKNSLSSGSQPLFLVDGVPFPTSLIGSDASVIGIVNGGQSPIANLNPQDIESVEVLKDADATAIYGTRGANGVVLITTKKGQSGKTAVSANFSQGVGEVTRMLSLLNTQQYVQMRKEAFKNDAFTPTAAVAYDLVSWDTTRYTDWQKELIGGSAMFTNANLSLSGGNNTTNYLLSGNYSRQTTVFPGDFADNKGGAHFSLQHSSADRRFSLSLGAIYGTNSNKLLQNNLTSLVTIPPNSPQPYNSLGNLVWNENGANFNNPFGLLLQTSNNISNNLNSNLSLNYKILEDLNLSVSSGYTYMGVNQFSKTPIASLRPSATAVGSAYFGNSSYKNWIVEPRLNYTKQILKGKLDVLLGTSFQRDVTNTSLIRATGFTNDELLESAAAAPATANSVSAATNNVVYNYQSIFGRVNYTWENKYILNLNYRRDGSSRFGPGKQFGNFGSVGAAWVFSGEKAVRDLLPILSYGKLRSSYGVTGNDQIGDYGYFDTYSSSNGGLVPSKLFNPDFAWERNRKFEVGLELGFFKDRLLLSGSWFRNRIDNQLVNYALPSQTGFGSYLANLDALIQNQGYEITLASTNLKSNTFTWQTDFNISAYRNKLVSFPGLASSSYANTYFIGQSVYSRTLFDYTGLDATTGLYQFNGTADPADRKVLKDFTPKFFGGMNNTFTYHNFSLSFFFQFVKQDGYNYTSAQLSAPGSLSNQTVGVLDRWQKPGDVKPVQKYSAIGSPRTVYSYYTNSDAIVTDASFIRLKNIYLSYSLPAKIVSRLKIGDIKFFLQGQNVITWTKYQGFDPETSAMAAVNLPPLKVFTGGLQVTF